MTCFELKSFEYAVVLPNATSTPREKTCRGDLGASAFWYLDVVISIGYRLLTQGVVPRTEERLCHRQRQRASCIPVHAMSGCPVILVVRRGREVRGPAC